MYSNKQIISNRIGWVDYCQLGFRQLWIYKCTLVRLSWNWQPPIFNLFRKHRKNQPTWFPALRLHVIFHMILILQLQKHKCLMAKFKPHPIRYGIELPSVHFFFAQSKFYVVCDWNDLMFLPVVCELWFSY